MATLKPGKVDGPSDPLSITLYCVPTHNKYVALYDSMQSAPKYSTYIGIFAKCIF